MGDLIPNEIRGRHFGWRSRIFASVQLLATLIVGGIARNYTTQSTPWLFFTLIFFIAASFRFSSTLFINRQYEPKTKVNIKPVLKIKIERPMLLFIFANAFMQASAILSGPFFSVWWLRDLHFNYLTYSMISSAGILGSILVAPMWGRLCDCFGYHKLFRVTGILISVIPVPHLFFSHPAAIFIANLYSGICWSGYTLMTFNYLLNNSDKERPEQSMAIASAATGIFGFLASLTGGFLATRLPIILTWQLRSLFLLSSVLRICVAIIFYPLLAKYDCKTAAKDNVLNYLPGVRTVSGLMKVTFRAFRKF